MFVIINLFLFYFFFFFGPCHTFLRNLSCCVRNAHTDKTQDLKTNTKLLCQNETLQSNLAIAFQTIKPLEVNKKSTV